MEVIETKDGSSSIYHSKLDEHYHSPRGAISESLYVYIDKGLRITSKPEINLLEVGFGTGLNALLTIKHGRNKSINYHTLEPYPLTSKILEEVNYSSILHLKDENFKLHSANWDSKIELNTTFNFTKYKQELLNFKPSTKFDLVYYDAFAPSKQPEMWTLDSLEHIYNLMKKDGIFVTYCAAGEFKRNMKKIGFELEKLPGANGKKEMTRAKKL